MAKSYTGLDSILFQDGPTWGERVSQLLGRHKANRFVAANTMAIERLLIDATTGRRPDPKTGPRVVVNISAMSLLAFLKDGSYRNAYELRQIIGSQRLVSKSRNDADTLLELEGGPEEYYFCAVAVNGTGVRFYGEYCMVLRAEEIDGSTRILDRNSYDLVRPPLSGIPQKRQAALVRCLRGTWEKDVVQMLCMKILPALEESSRLVTAGIVSQSVLDDEDFVEVQKRGTFHPPGVEEIRENPGDHVAAERIQSRLANGLGISAEELLWCARRREVDRQLAKARIKTRTVVSEARSGRWS